MRHLKGKQIFTIAALGGIGAALICSLFMPGLALMAGANMFFVLYIILLLLQMNHLDVAYLQQRAQDSDEPVLLIFLVTIIVICAAIGSLFLSLNVKPTPALPVLVFSLMSVPLGWFTIHAIFSLHYAKLFWQGDIEEPSGGLDFPGTKDPVGWDFLYFSLVLGMTAQTADTSITSTGMRRTAMGDSILAFFLNTVIIAAAVNVVVSLA